MPRCAHLRPALLYAGSSWTSLHHSDSVLVWGHGLRAPHLQVANSLEAITAHPLASLLTSAQHPLLSLQFPGSFQKPLLWPFLAASLQHTPCADSTFPSCLGRWGGGRGSGVLTFLAGVCIHCPLIASMDTWGKQVEFDSHLHLAQQFSSPDDTGEQVQTAYPASPGSSLSEPQMCRSQCLSSALGFPSWKHNVAWLGGWSSDGGRLLCPQRVTAV